MTAVCNLDNEVEFLNTVSNLENDDIPDEALTKAGVAAVLGIGPTKEGKAALDAALNEIERAGAKRLMHDIRVDEKKLEAFPELLSVTKTLVSCFYAMTVTAGKPLTESQAENAKVIINDANEAIGLCEKLLRGELP